ncbi:cell division control protein 6 [Methanoculleus sp. FWC-SCC3]|uniref:ORC1-type DNA replication protein n=1 Tax=Methanoculleus methanifontis TaxID=2584086 RepID=A0ABT8LZQ6_9EURY|nr:AAA family ATPase [Methanoculleus sp. FWC-SCC3]MDN7011933.1 cell division control protein 6 [Methanoculleus sp. FWC-SCC3]
MTHSPLLRSDETLFRDPEVFEFTFLPEQIHYRDAQVRELAFLLQPALRGGSAGSAVIRGPPGTGKTTTVHRIFAEVTETTKKLVPVYVNCRHDRTALAVFGCIFEQAFGYAPPSRHLDGIKRGIAARLRDEDAALVVCLDDANELIPAGTYNTLLYQILRLYERWDVRKPGVFAVASDLGLNLYAEADESVRSVFHPTEVNFPPYTKAEIRGILADRIRQGLYPGVVSKSLLDRIAGIAAGEQDIRVGIDLVRLTVLRAEKDGRRRVAPADVTAAAQAVRSPALRARVAGLSEGERALLYRIAELSVVGADMIGGAVFEEVQDYLPVGRTTYHEHLNGLANAGIVDLVPGAGRGREVRLRYDPGEVLAVCKPPDRR